MLFNNETMKPHNLFSNTTPGFLIYTILGLSPLLTLKCLGIIVIKSSKMFLINSMKRGKKVFSVAQYLDAAQSWNLPLSSHFWYWDFIWQWPVLWGIEFSHAPCLWYQWEWKPFKCPYPHHWWHTALSHIFPKLLNCLFPSQPFIFYFLETFFHLKYITWIFWLNIGD